MKNAYDLKKGDKLIITDASDFKDDCKWLQGQEVEVVEVTQLDHFGGYIRAQHPKEPILWLLPKYVEKVEK